MSPIKIVILLAAVAVEFVSSSVQAVDVPGQFDYYLLSLSWSPQYCRNLGKRAPSTQCGGSKRFGFVVHGLWPEYSVGWPEYCDWEPEDVPSEWVERMMPIMPGTDLIQHEWDKHGKCSGLDLDGYFQATETLYKGIHTPKWMKKLRSAKQVSRTRLIADWLQENPDLTETSVVLACQGNMLSEVRICYDRTFQPMPCELDLLMKQCDRKWLKIAPITIK